MLVFDIKGIRKLSMTKLENYSLFILFMTILLSFQPTVIENVSIM